MPKWCSVLKVTGYYLIIQLTQVSAQSHSSRDLHLDLMKLHRALQSELPDLSIHPLIITQHVFSFASPFMLKCSVN